MFVDIAHPGGIDRSCCGPLLEAVYLSWGLFDKNDRGFAWNDLEAVS